LSFFTYYVKMSSKGARNFQNTITRIFREISKNTIFWASGKKLEKVVRNFFKSIKYIIFEFSTQIMS